MMVRCGLPMLKVTGVLDELRDIYPVADGVVITEWLGTHTTTRDLSVASNWGELLSDVAEAAEGWPPNYDVLLALLPAAARATRRAESATRRWSTAGRPPASRWRAGARPSPP